MENLITNLINNLVKDKTYNQDLKNIRFYRKYFLYEYKGKPYN